MSVRTNLLSKSDAANEKIYKGLEALKSAVSHQYHSIKMESCIRCQSGLENLNKEDYQIYVDQDANVEDIIRKISIHSNGTSLFFTEGRKKVVLWAAGKIVFTPYLDVEGNFNASAKPNDYNETNSIGAARQRVNLGGRRDDSGWKKLCQIFNYFDGHIEDHASEQATVYRTVKATQYGEHVKLTSGPLFVKGNGQGALTANLDGNGVVRDILKSRKWNYVKENLPTIRALENGVPNQPMKGKSFQSNDHVLVGFVVEGYNNERMAGTLLKLKMVIKIHDSHDNAVHHQEDFEEPTIKIPALKKRTLAERIPGMARGLPSSSTATADYGSEFDNDDLLSRMNDDD